MRTQLHQSMKDVADQNVTALRNQIRSNELLLDGVISEIENTDNRSEAVLKYQNFVEQYGLKRLGYCQPDGMTISTDGAIVDLSHRGFFQRGMEGKATISGVLIDVGCITGATTNHWNYLGINIFLRMHPSDFENTIL